ncbi:MAG: putative 2-aminoethylphosphonate ABC transporter ATP-binding protein [Alphaproteobacteria bacterium]
MNGSQHGGRQLDDAPLLSVVGVGKRFGSFSALSGIDLDIHDGEFLCCLGPSGCGKSTLLRIIAGLERQSAGRILQSGRDISELPASRREFGIVFQSYALFPNLNVTENIGYGLRNRRMARAAIARRVAELLDLVGLGGKERKFPGQLSGGEQQRVALARALAPSPRVLLLDEPLSALDAQVRVHLRHQIRHLQKRLGLTTIMVTHDQEEALTIADRVVVMRQGVIEQIATPLTLYRDPRTPFVASFVGKMNFLHGTVSGDGRLRVGEGALAVSWDAARPAAGSRIVACLRPEDIRLAGGVGEEANRFAATIAEVEFQGAFWLASLSIPKLGAASLTLQYSTNEARDREISSGQSLDVILPFDRFRLFPAEGDGIPSGDARASAR